MKTTDLIVYNTFRQISHDEFNTELALDAMSQWKRQHMSVIRDELYEDFDYSSATTYHFRSNMLEKQRAKIFEDERHSIDTSIETLRFLNLIIYNIVQLEEKGISVPGIVAVGKYLRTRGQYIDFVKLDKWMTQLHIKRISSFIASLLLQTFSFEADELPFLYKRYPKAYEQLCMATAQGKSAKHKMSPRAILMYSPIAAFALWYQSITTALTNIEE